ncbi:hypothetical protein KJ782_06365 [Patescibacteria group bacterium]|nr:hypothetical protein [Patescibacteria group bacterium]
MNQKSYENYDAKSYYSSQLGAIKKLFSLKNQVIEIKIPRGIFYARGEIREKSNQAEESRPALRK